MQMQDVWKGYYRALLKWGITDHTSDASEQSWTWRYQQSLTLHHQRFYSESTWKISTFNKNAFGKNHQMHEKIWHLGIPEDMKACVFLQCFCQTSSTVRGNAIGRETKQQCSNRSQIAHSISDRWIHFIKLNSSRCKTYLRLVRLGWFFRASANASAPSSPMLFPHILQPFFFNVSKLLL